eukprot:1156772-Pelagomonas_calceolata.AAC.7
MAADSMRCERACRLRATLRRWMALCAATSTQLYHAACCMNMHEVDRHARPQCTIAVPCTSYRWHISVGMLHTALEQLPFAAGQLCVIQRYMKRCLVLQSA